MNVVSITGERQCELVQRPTPTASGDVVVVKIEAAPMCTEYKIYVAGQPTDNLGHEAAGVVEEVAQRGRVQVGDRVVVMPQYSCGRCPLCLQGEYIHCQHTFNPLEVTGNIAGTATYAQYLLKPDWMLVPIPDDITTEHGAMACCGLGPTFGAMQRMQVSAFDTMLITGLGPVGLGGIINGVYRGARVIAVEAHPYRIELAKSLGATAVIHPADDALRQILELTNGVGVDKAIDCSGNVQAQRLLIDATRRKGQVAFVGEAGELALHISNDMIRKGLTLHGQWHYNLADTPRIMQVIRTSRDLLDKLMTHTFPLSRVQEAFELQLTGQCGKVMLQPWA
ncbi:MAG: zinc-binding dehydrogenase [Abitibacteriaceae bacterium]|nr:zinc-binding dehydrogenase [Abditibacteriaceae bacterium]